MDKIFIGYVVAIHNKKNRMTCQTFLTFSSGQSVSSQYVLIPYTVHLFLLVACILSHIIEYKKDANTMKSAMLYFMLFVRVALYVVLFGEILLAEQYWNRFIQHLDIFLSEITFYVSPCRDCFQPVCAWTV